MTDRPDFAQSAGAPTTPCAACSRAFNAVADNDAQLRDLNERLYADLASVTRERDALLARLERAGMTP